jgi:hydroxymethylpyrimidine pyrophosphatase-like HAD family hydrolase
MVNPNIAETDETKEALAILSEKLEEITKIVKPKHLEKLKKVPIWIQYKLKTDGAMWYHSNKDWLISNGYPAEMEKSIEISNVRHFIDWQDDQPLMVLHEFAHAHQDLDLPELEDKLTQAYQNALTSGKYNSVSYIRGGKQKAYAMNNKIEYFAELTEAYFGQNDYYPFNKKDLEAFDPTGFKLMQEAWK